MGELVIALELHIFELRKLTDRLREMCWEEEGVSCFDPRKETDRSGAAGEITTDSKVPEVADHPEEERVK